jgi:mannose-1-phosphate guanylyltransferase
MDAYNTANEQNYVNACFEQCESISVDFAIMENAKNIEIILANFDWSDLGTWGSLFGHLEKDEAGNSIQNKNVQLPNSQNCLVKIPEGTTAVIEGLEGYIVIQTEDKLMILRQEQEQELKKYIE